MRTLVVDIGGTKSAVGVVDGNELIEHVSWRYPTGADAVAVRSLLQEKLRLLHSPFSACGVSFGGSFDFRDQRCGRSFHVSGWEGFALQSWMQDLLGIPVVCDNDANVAAIGEFSRLSPFGQDSLMYVTLSTGVGAAFIVNGSLWRGAHSLAGELGHVDVGHAQACSCGQTGCLERAVSGYWLQHDFGDLPESVLEDEFRFQDWTQLLCRGLWTAVTLIDPAVIVVGGGMVAQGDRLRNRLQQLLDNRASLADRSAPRLEMGDATGRSVLIGAELLAREAMA